MTTILTFHKCSPNEKNETVSLEYINSLNSPHVHENFFSKDKKCPSIHTDLLKRYKKRMFFKFFFLNLSQEINGNSLFRRNFIRNKAFLP